jgi:hypothetical protein
MKIAKGDLIKIIEEATLPIGKADFLATPLHHGVQSGRIDVVEALIKKYPQYINSTAYSSQTPLHCLINAKPSNSNPYFNENLKAQITKLLLKHGADPLLEDGSDCAFIIACYQRKAEMVEVMLTHLALDDSHPVLNRGLEYAFKSRDDHLIAVFARNGCAEKVMDFYKQNFYSIAARDEFELSGFDASVIRQYYAENDVREEKLEELNKTHGFIPLADSDGNCDEVVDHAYEAKKSAQAELQSKLEVFNNKQDNLGLFFTGVEKPHQSGPNGEHHIHPVELKI